MEMMMVRIAMTLMTTMVMMMIIMITMITIMMVIKMMMMMMIIIMSIMPLALDSPQIELIVLVIVLFRGHCHTCALKFNQLSILDRSLPFFF